MKYHGAISGWVVGWLSLGGSRHRAPDSANNNQRCEHWERATVPSLRVPYQRKYTVVDHVGEWNTYSQAVTSIQWSGRTWGWITPNNPWPCPLLTLTALHRERCYSSAVALISIFNLQKPGWADQCISLSDNPRFSLLYILIRFRHSETKIPILWIYHIKYSSAHFQFQYLTCRSKGGLSVLHSGPVWVVLSSKFSFYHQLLPYRIFIAQAFTFHSYQY